MIWHNGWLVDSNQGQPIGRLDGPNKFERTAKAHKQRSLEIVEAFAVVRDRANGTWCRWITRPGGVKPDKSHLHQPSTHSRSPQRRNIRIRRRSTAAPGPRLMTSRKYDAPVFMIAGRSGFHCDLDQGRSITN